jgi:hypothetical protein
LALDKGVSFLHSQERNKEERDIVVDPLESSLIKTARRAPPGMGIEVHCFWLNPTYEKTHRLPLLVVVHIICTGGVKRNGHEPIKNLVIEVTSTDPSPP